MNIGYRIPTGVNTEPAERKIDLRQYLNFVWRNWMFVASVTAFVFLMGVIYLVRAIPLYTATTQVLLEQSEKAPGLDAIVNDGRNSYSYLENQLAILRSDSLLQRVAIKEFAPPSTKDDKDDPASREKAIIAGVNRLRGALAVSRSGQAQVLNIAITWDDPVRAAQLAKQLDVRQALLQSREDRQGQPGVHLPVQRHPPFQKPNVCEHPLVTQHERLHRVLVGFFEQPGHRVVGITARFQPRPGSFIPFVLIGLGLAWLFWSRGTLWDSILFHFFFNSASFLILAWGS